MDIHQVRNVNRNRRPLLAWQPEKQQPNCEVAWMHFLSRYKGSHIHGFYQLCWPTLRTRMRLLWTLALLCAFTALVYIIYCIAERNRSVRFHTIIDNSHWPIQNIAFPVVIVCNRNRLNWSRLPQIVKRYNISAAQQPLLERVLTAFDSLSFGRLNVFESLEDQSLNQLNHLNFTQVVTEMAWRCDELLGECSWQTQSWNCCELFQPRRLPEGSCLAFNELEQRASVEAGRGTGIVVRLFLNEAQHAPSNQKAKGFVLNVVEPGVWSNNAIHLWPDTDTSVGVRAVFHYFDENTYALHSVQRQCIFDNEQATNQRQSLQGYRYMMENCLAECQQLYMVRYCNCTLDLFYPPSDHVACQLKDLPCLAAHNELMQNYVQPGEYPYVSHSEKGLICDCPLNCKSLTLLNDVRKKLIHPRKLDVLNVSGMRHKSNRSMLLNVYYKRNFVLVYKTSLIHTWVDLIVGFGAICQLCLGCSIISLLELLYFAVVDLPHFCWTQYGL